MRARILSIVAILLTVSPVMPTHAAMQEDVDQAVTIIERFQEIPEKAIPTAVMRDAKGLAILTIKGGFIFTGRDGTGIVVARTEKGWSGPSAIGTGGIGFGFQAGVQVSELVILLNTPVAVVAFLKGGNVTIGGALSVAAGPVGRDAEGSLTLGAAMYTYSRSQGLFAGVSLEGTVIGIRNETNAEYYGEPVDANDILSGRYSRRPVRRVGAGSIEVLSAVNFFSRNSKNRRDRFLPKYPKPVSVERPSGIPRESSAYQQSGSH